MRLVAKAITVTVGASMLLDNVDLTAERSQMLGVVGPNGAGKSTLLRVLAALRRPERGTVRYGNHFADELPPGGLAQQLAYLAQRGPVAWPLTVERMVALGRIPHLRGWGTRDDAGAAAIEAALADTDTWHLRDRVLQTLSGGELARALLARALAVGGSVLLADEPVSELDPYHQLQVMEILRARADAGQTVVVVLHELTLAARFCDRLLLLDTGRVIADGLPHEVLTDQHLHATYRVSAARGEHDGTAYLVPWRRADDSSATT